MIRHPFARISTVILLSLLWSSSWRTVTSQELDESKPIHVSGQVLDPDGKPVAASLKVMSVRGQVVTETSSDDEGNFELSFRPADIDRPFTRDWGDAVLVATAAGFGPAWIRTGELRRDRRPVLELARDDVPIQAQIVDADGRPVGGAELRIYSIIRPDKGNLDAYLKEMRDEPLQSRYEREHLIYLPPEAVELTIISGSRSQRTEPDGDTAEVFRTDEEGRLELRGIGMERKLHIELKHPRISRESFHVLTREHIDAKWNRTKLSRNTRIMLESGAALPIIYGAKFTHVATPSRPIVGTITDHATGAPLTGVGVSAQMKGQSGGGYAKTDEQGQYEVHGVPTGGTVSLYAVCPKGMPYLNAERDRVEFSAAAPLTDTDFQLVKGTMIRGRLLDPAGNPVQGRVEYLALQSNEYAHRLPDPLGSYGGYITGSDGDLDDPFQVVALPGLGLLVAKTYDERFLRATPDNLDVPIDKRGYINTVNSGLIRPQHYDVVQPITVPPDAEVLTIDLHLKSAESIPGSLVDSKGQPVHGAVAMGITPDGFRESLDTYRFAVSGLRPGEERTLMFRHAESRLGAVVKLEPDSRQELTVTMRPYATLSGRIVDEHGRPVPKALFALMSQGAQIAIEKRIAGEVKEPKPLELAEGQADADGRFRIDDAISNYPCELLIAPPSTRGRRIVPQLVTTISLRSGERRELGDVKLEITD